MLPVLYIPDIEFDLKMTWHYIYILIQSCSVWPIYWHICSLHAGLVKSFGPCVCHLSHLTNRKCNVFAVCMLFSTNDVNLIICSQQAIEALCIYLELEEVHAHFLFYFFVFFLVSKFLKPLEWYHSQHKLSRIDLRAILRAYYERVKDSRFSSELSD